MSAEAEEAIRQRTFQANFRAFREKWAMATIARHVHWIPNEVKMERILANKGLTAHRQKVDKSDRNWAANRATRENMENELVMLVAAAQ
eukprot:6745656-Prymnesium_polylepis.1